MRVTKLVWVTAAAVAAGVAAAIGLNSAVMTVTQVDSESMAPTLQAGQTIAVWRPGELSRFDVVSFDGRGSFVPLAHERAIFVKRVIGMPGDRVSCCDAQGQIVVNGASVSETFVAPANADEVPFDVVVPAEKLWLMGDNRANSTDSRAFLGAPGGGFVPMDRVQGRVLAIVLPPGDFQWWGLSSATEPPAAR